MRNSVAPSAVDGVSVNVRTPRNRPSGIPPVHTIRCGGWNSATVSGNARPGLIGTNSFILRPGAMSPSTRSTAGFHSGYPDASVRISHTFSGAAAMRALDS
jgi:hypothetical protein